MHHKIRHFLDISTIHHSTHFHVVLTHATHNCTYHCKCLFYHNNSQEFTFGDQRNLEQLWKNWPVKQKLSASVGIPTTFLGSPGMTGDKHKKFAAIKQKLQDGESNNLRCVGNLQTSSDAIVEQWPAVHVRWSVYMCQVHSSVPTTAIGKIPFTLVYMYTHRVGQNKVDHFTFIHYISMLH